MSKKNYVPLTYSRMRTSLFVFLLAISAKVFSQPCTPPTASISLVSTSVCQGTDAYLQLNAATGQGPYELIVNGVTYSNVNVGQTFGPLATSDKSIWSDLYVPATIDANDGGPIETGVKFRSSVNGYIKGIRYYKGPGNTGIHTGSLWSAAGNLLAKATFIGETVSGWQEVMFNAPIAITANTTYIASYFSQDGYYAYSPGYFATQGETNGSLTALQSGVDGANGVYRFGSTGFPAQAFNDNNYAVDVLFTESIAVSLNDYVLTSIIDANGCSNSGTLSTATLTVNPNPTGVLSMLQASVCAGQQIILNFEASTGTGPFTIVTNSVTNSGVNNNQPFASGINAAQPNPAPVSIWPTGTVTGIATVVTDNAAIEVGVKFRSAIGGNITGIRFYKRVENTGTHTGSIWSPNGTLLGTATFINETASGWQEISFSTPITIIANQTFTASYFSEAGQYAFTPDYFAGYSATNGPLTAVDGNGTYGPNGVYTYGGGYPTSSYNNTNYWVDVVFVPNQGYNAINMTQITDDNGCTTSASPIQTVNLPSGQCIALPVTLIDFKLSMQDKNVQLTWETSSENGNKGFDLERSLDNSHWQKIGFVQGAGTSTIKQSYSFTDKGLSAGKYYYRLRQIDLDNKFTFSKVLAAEIKGGVQNYLGQNYPNPVLQQNATINYGVDAQSLVNISLYDVQGRMIKVLLNETKVAGQYTLNANLASLIPGTYYYKMRTGTFTETKKLVIGYK